MTNGYISGPDAAVEPRRIALGRVATADQVVLVEGVTDQIAIETLATRVGRDLAGEGVVIAPMGGAHAIDLFLAVLDRRDAPPAAVRGLCDHGEVPVFRAALTRAGYGPLRTAADLRRIGFFVCDADLEAELIRALGAGRVEQLLDEHDDLKSFRTLQKQAAWWSQPVEAQLHRFLRSKARRMHRYASRMVDAIDPNRIPQPLLGVLGPIRAR